MTSVAPHADLVQPDAAIQPVRLPFAPRLVHLRLLRIDNRAGHHPAGVFQITIHLFRPQQHELSGVVEVIWLFRILGQVVRQLQPKADQVSDCILIFKVGQPPGLRRHGNLLGLRHRLPQLRLNPLCYRHHLRLGRPRFFLLRRHLTRLQHVENQFPTLQHFSAGQIAVEIMQRHLAFGLFRPVALHAVGLEENRHYGIKPSLARRHSLQLNRKTQKGSQHESPNDHGLAFRVACLMRKSTSAWL